jgi:hypothetical protein
MNQQDTQDTQEAQKQPEQLDATQSELIAKICADLGLQGLKVVSNEEFMHTLDDQDDPKLSVTLDGNMQHITNTEIRDLLNNKQTSE